MGSLKTAFQLQNTKAGKPIGPVCVSPTYELVYYLLRVNQVEVFRSERLDLLMPKFIYKTWKYCNQSIYEKKFKTIIKWLTITFFLEIDLLYCFDP